MIRAKKLTPLAFGYRVMSRHPPQPELTVIMRGKFHCHPRRRCELVKGKIGSEHDKPELPPEGRVALEEAEYILGQGPPTADMLMDGDDDRIGQLVYPSDFAEFKVKSDVMLKGTCYPRGGSAKRCRVTFAVGDTFEKHLEVFGPRVWIDKVLGGKHTEEVAFKAMPIDYRHAYGGPEVAANPVGLGYGDQLPNVEDPKHLIGRSTQTPQPAGFGPINPTWPLRQGKMGKNYGDDYERTRAPWYADDYDWTQQSAAPADQQLDGYLRGDETMRFCNMHPESSDFSVTLPGLRPRAFAKLESGEVREAGMVCDTLFVDLDEGVVYVTWRGQITVQEDDLSDVKYLLLAHETLADKPKEYEEYEAAIEAFADDPAGLKSSKVATLQEFEERLESGELERELDELPANEEPVSAVFKYLMGISPRGGEMLDNLREGMQKSYRDPEARPAVIAALKKALKELREGTGAAMPMLDRDKGEIAAGPFMRNVLRQVSTAQKEALDAGADLGDANEKIEDAVASIELGGVKDADLRIPDPNETPPDPAPDVDFSGHDLSERDFAGLDLSRCNFDGTLLRKTNFVGARLVDASFVGASLAAADLSGADCTGANFGMANLTKTRAVGTCFRGGFFGQCVIMKADLTRADLSGATGSALMCHKAVLDEVVAAGADLEKAHFDSCSMNGVDFSEGKLVFALFRQTPLRGARFEAAQLTNTGFLECDLNDARFMRVVGDTINFKESTLRNADFSYAVMPSSIFLQLDAAGATFSAADMPLARFYRVILSQADFQRANLFKTDFRKAALTDARFNGANLYGACLNEAFGTDADFRKANLVMANLKRNKLVMKR